MRRDVALGPSDGLAQWATWDGSQTLTALCSADNFPNFLPTFVFHGCFVGSHLVPLLVCALSRRRQFFGFDKMDLIRHTLPRRTHQPPELTLTA